MTLERKKLGSSGEDLATEYLEKKNYKIIFRNLRLKYGEADIIAQDGDYIVIVEVKTKRFFGQGRPEEQVDYFKQKKLRLLARGISQLYPDRNIRIDVIAVDETGLRPKINHIINAVEGV
ncbi:hypothetical protein A3F08_00870 [Candidatus Berkelbacteria bacterium RIFCSPHIGHO2_12_FULL_36_9]|uniref:UPF0102 protein A3F08_00870 n=1 Tax=Candidatus Berkelbacteria bacterium RIFCSPHIGHO2_12_FULL_36_9 TaxID=1797469 RepID=A0A1F5EI50_9BACT|nr:MAG: hypothetical protein A3F08_00870 [Candidatus Berkelbacteria bacterium RIFCSPHIGHO2_12_FULL_36_9]